MLACWTASCSTRETFPFGETAVASSVQVVPDFVAVQVTWFPSTVVVAVCVVWMPPASAATAALAARSRPASPAASARTACRSRPDVVWFEDISEAAAVAPTMRMAMMMTARINACPS